MEIDFELMGNRIREARKRKGWTQENLSEELDVAIAFISRIERGKTEVSLKRLSQIARILDVPIEELITGVAPKNGKYLDRDINRILEQCTPDKQKLIYNIAKILSGIKFV